MAKARPKGRSGTPGRGGGGKGRNARSRKASGGRHWLVLPLALGLAVAVGWVFLTGPAPPQHPREPLSPVRRAAADHAADHAKDPNGPHSEIRDESREQLLEILRTADGDAG